MYYAQSFFIAFKEKNLFEDDCEAWVHGPAYSKIYAKYKGYGYNPIEEDVTKFKKYDLTEEEKAVIDEVLLNFGCYSGKVLEEMTHAVRPWQMAREGLKPNQLSNEIIDKENIKAYFTEIKAKYKLINIADISEYSTDLYRKNRR